MIKHTSNYDQFIQLTYNREVNQAHVRSLMASISKQNLLNLNPILVTKKMEVIDGQHRLEAAKALKLPIHYIVSDQEFSGTEIQLLNTNSKNWAPADYLSYWSIKKAPGYNVLSKFLNKHPLIPMTAARCLMSDSGESRATDFANGHLDVSNLNFAEEIAEQLKDYRNRGYVFVYSSKFIRALSTVNNVDGYEHEEMMRKIDLQPRAFVLCANQKQYLQMFEELYNYRNQKKVRFI